MLADVLSRRLGQQGFATRTAESGTEGLALARSAHPDLILLDLRLPDTDGFAICEELADSPETCTIPIIILSGLEQPDIIRRSRLAGCHYFVRKPYDPNALLVLIRHALEEASGWGDGRRRLEGGDHAGGTDGRTRRRHAPGRPRCLAPWNSSASSTRPISAAWRNGSTAARHSG